MDASNEPEPVSILIMSNHNSSDRYKKNNRRILSQVCATMAQSLLIMDLGMMIAVTTIVIGELHNAKEGLSLNDSQCSWFGSIMLLCTPLGSVLSGCVQGIIGRKTSMLLVNVPHLAAWYMMYAAQSVETLYAASFLMGIGNGFLEAPTLSYIGEVSEPRLRGILATFANSNVVIGHLLEYLLGYLLPWRMAILVSCAVPLVATVAISMIPESPIWLLTRGKNDEAMSSLRWLRGWASIDEVSDEFQSLELYCEMSQNEFIHKCEANIKKSSGYIGVSDGENITKCKPSFVECVKDLIRPEILKPLQLVAIYFFFFHAASITAMRPYMIEVFYQLKVPMSPSVLTVISAGLQGAGALTCMCLVHLVGKRILSLVSMTCCTLCCLLLGVYAYSTHWYSAPSIPLLLLCTLYYFMNVGISPVPWMLISEVFPTRGRGVAGGLCASFFYITAFLVSKTWLNFQNLVELHGCFFLYGIVGCFGIQYLFINLPETEGKSLAEIERCFAKKCKT